MFSIIPEAYAMSGQGGGNQGITGQLAVFAVIFAIFYFLVIRPQQKKQKETQKMLSELEKGDQVVTGSGIYGTIHKFNADQDYALLEIAEKTVVKIQKSQITELVKKAKSPANQPAASESKSK